VSSEYSSISNNSRYVNIDGVLADHSLFYVVYPRSFDVFNATIKMFFTDVGSYADGHSDNEEKTVIIRVKGDV